LASLLFLNLIASILLVVLAEPIVRLLFEHGDKFTATSTARVTYALKCLAPGLVAFSTVNILARAFYALGDTRTPMKISIVCLVINFIISCILIQPMHEGGPGIANMLTSLINVGLLVFALRKKLARLEMTSLRTILLPLAVAGLLAGIIAWQGWRLWENFLGHETLALKIGAVFVPAIAAGLVYGMLALLFKIPAAKEMLEFAFARFRK
jgi:putative peptidoglycan lipid II flippase